MTDLFLRLVNMSIAASWIVLVVAVLRLLLQRAPKWSHCLMWSMVGLRLVMPFSLKSIFSLVPQVEVQDIPYPGRPTIQTPPPAAGVPAGTVPSTPARPIVPPSPADPIPVADQSPDLMTVLAVVWLVGCAVLLVYGIFCYLRLYRRVSASLHLGDDIFICDDIASPFLLGILYPRVYLPSGIPDEQIPYILAHEKAHRSRKDHLWKLLGFVLLAVYWFNPVMWLAYSLFCRDIELACDEMVIRKMDRGDKQAYSQALLSCAAPRRTILISPLAFGEVGIKKRIKSVLHYRRPAFWVTLTAVMTCIIVGVCFLTDPYQAAEALPDSPDDLIDPAIEPATGGVAVTAVIAYPELVPEELATSPLYAEALSRPSAILYNGEPVTDRAPVDAFLEALEQGKAGELYLYDFGELEPHPLLQAYQLRRLSFEHFLTDNGMVQEESSFIYGWDGSLDLITYSVDEVYLSNYGKFVYHEVETTYPSAAQVVNLREIFPNYEELTRLLDTYVYPLDYTAIDDEWDWPGRPPSNWLDLFESFYAHENGHLPYEDYGDDWPVEEMTATVNRYFDGVTRQMVIGSNYRATYNAATDTLHYVGGRGGAPDPVRVIGWGRDGELLTLYYEAYDGAGMPIGAPYALTVELMEDGSFRYRSSHAVAVEDVRVPEDEARPDENTVVIPLLEPPSVPHGAQLEGLDFSAMGREELIQLLQPVLDGASYFCEFGLVGELKYRLGIVVDHDPDASIRRPYRNLDEHVFYPYQNFPYQTLEELRQDMLTVFTADNLEGPLAYIFQNMIDENGKVYIPSDVSGYTQARRWQLENMEIVSAERTKLTLSMPVAAGWGDETWIAPLNFEVRDGYIVMDNSYFSIDPANL